MFNNVGFIGSGPLTQALAPPLGHRADAGAESATAEARTA